MNLTHWDIIIGSFIASIAPTIMSYAALVNARTASTISARNEVVGHDTKAIASDTNEAVKAVAKSVNGILSDRVKAAEAVGQVKEQDAQAGREKNGS